MYGKAGDRKVSPRGLTANGHTMYRSDGVSGISGASGNGGDSGGFGFVLVSTGASFVYVNCSG